jgi:transcriptional regulator with XRE-family HTH domain
MNQYYSCNDRLSPMKNEKLQNARNERGFTQRQLANKVGVALVTLRKWEGGTRSPSSSNRDLLCQILGKTEDDDEES